MRRAPGLRALPDRAAATTRSARSGAARGTSRRPRRPTRAPTARPRPAARALAPPPRAGQGRRGMRRASGARSPRRSDPLARLRHLPAQVEVAIAAGDVAVARAAADELDSIIDAYKIGGRRAPAFDGTLHFARGQIALAEGDTDAAESLLRRARDDWQDVGAPYETAQARLALGIAFRRAGDEHAATAEIEAALAAFERLGARLDEAQLPRPARQGRRSAHLPLHGHRGLDRAARDAGRGQVEAPADAPQRDRA